MFKGLPEAVTLSARETDALMTQDKCFLGKMQIFFPTENLLLQFLLWMIIVLNYVIFNDADNLF